jgi:predicted Zn-dependent protease
MVYGSSRAQGIMRDNRFYHAELGITLAFPRAWTVENQRDRCGPTRSTATRSCSITVAVPPGQGPREFLLTMLRGSTVTGGEQLNSNGMDGYSVITTSGSPLDGGAGPVRWVTCTAATRPTCSPAPASSSRNSTPEADGLFLSVAQTMRSLKPAEYPASRAVPHAHQAGHR